MVFSRILFFALFIFLIKKGKLFKNKIYGYRNVLINNPKPKYHDDLLNH